MNMNIQYEKLCKIEFKHSYYAGGILKEFNLQTPSATQNKMRRDIVTRQTEGEVVFYAGQARPINTTNLHFSINLQNPYFLVFTAISLGKNNDHKEIEVSGEKKYFFSNANAIEGVIRMEKCRLVNTRFEVEFRAENEVAKKLELLDAEGNLIYEAEVGQEKKYVVDVSEKIQSSSSCQLVYDGKKVEKLFVTSAAQEYSGMGILEVDPSKGVDYSIQLESRKVHFRYNLIPRDGQKNSTFKIKANDGQAVVYEQQEEKTLPNGQASIPILLKEKVALAERPTKTFLLEMEESGNTMSIRLPFADPNTIKRLETNNQSEAYIAEMYIYL